MWERLGSVCQKAFAAQHGITIGPVRWIAKSTATEISEPKDRRGKHSSYPLVTSHMVKKQIEDHIKVMKSHYKTSRRKYLSSQLSIAEIHRVFVDKYEHDVEKPAVFYAAYVKVFDTIFNLGLGQPQSDTCPTCEKIKNELSCCDESKQATIQTQQREHLSSAKAFYKGLQQSTRQEEFQQSLPFHIFLFGFGCMVWICRRDILFTPPPPQALFNSATSSFQQGLFLGRLGVSLEVPFPFPSHCIVTATVA